MSAYKAWKSARVRSCVSLSVQYTKLLIQSAVGAVMLQLFVLEFGSTLGASTRVSIILVNAERSICPEFFTPVLIMWLASAGSAFHQTFSRPVIVL